MNLEADIKWIHRELNRVNDATLVAAIKNILEYRKSVARKPIDIEQYNKEIDEAVMDVENGRVHSHEEVGEIIKQWGKE